MTSFINDNSQRINFHKLHYIFDMWYKQSLFTSTWYCMYPPVT